MLTLPRLLNIFFCVALVRHLTAAEPQTIPLWDGTPPLAVPNDKPEAEMPLDPGMPPDIVRLGDVSTPSLTIYQPPAGQRNGTCVLICPGGGYYILAMKHEGTQVAEWLNSLGITAAVLKYRVPSPRSEPGHVRPLLDAQRAMTLLRRRADEWGIETNRIGVLGFSAGGNVAAWLLCEGNRWANHYPTESNAPGPRPDFGILIYPAYLAAPEKNRPTPQIRAEDPPGPVFFVHAADDKLGPENSIEFFLALKKAEVPGELHVYQSGGHGFGMLRQGHPINDWPARCAEWLRAQKFVAAGAGG